MKTCKNLISVVVERERPKIRSLRDARFQFKLFAFDYLGTMPSRGTDHHVCHHKYVLVNPIKALGKDCIYHFHLNAITQEIIM